VGRLQKEKMMKCIICHGAEVSPAEVFEEIGVGSDIIKVPVTVMVCGTCGERYYTRANMRHLESVREDIANKRARLDEVGKVLQFSPRIVIDQSP
jgi:YgiT-type zinc finger domain-containing protein